MLKYKKSVTHIMKIVYEMLNVANCEKINDMKVYTEIFNEIKSSLLLKRGDVDPYQFKPEQFD
jgi:hypothetical protein